MIAWGIFYTRLLNEDINVDNWNYCYEKYEEFKKHLNQWFSPSKSITIEGAIKHIRTQLWRERDLENVIVCGIKICRLCLVVAFPAHALIIKLSSGILLDGGLEIYRQLKKGEKINWKAVLFHSTKGALKGLASKNIASNGLFNIKLRDIVINFGIEFLINTAFNFIEGMLDEKFKENNNEIKLIKFRSILIGNAYEFGGFLVQWRSSSDSPPIKETRKILPEIQVPQLRLEFVKKAAKLAKEVYKEEFSIGRVVQKSKINDMSIPKFFCLEEERDLYVVIRGSQSYIDWNTDLNFIEVSKEYDGREYYFHRGFYAAANYILDNIDETLNGNYESIYFVGHSYAAGVSCILCFLTKMQEKFKNKNIYAMAYAPPPSMSRVPAEIAQSTFIFINRDDCVPHASFYNILNASRAGLITFSAGAIIRFLIYKKHDPKKSDSYIASFKSAISNSFNKLERYHVRHVHGVIFAIGFNKIKKLSDCRIAEDELPDVFSVSLVNYEDHYMDNYLSALEFFES